MSIIKRKEDTQRIVKWLFRNISVIMSFATLIATVWIGCVANRIAISTQIRDTQTMPLNIMVQDSSVLEEGNIDAYINLEITDENKNVVKNGVHFVIKTGDGKYSGDIKNLYIASFENDKVNAKYILLDSIKAEEEIKRKSTSEGVIDVSIDYKQNYNNYYFDNDSWTLQFEAKPEKKLNILFFTGVQSERRYYFVFEGYSGDWDILVFDYNPKQKKFITFQKRDLFDREYIKTKLTEYSSNYDVDDYINNCYNEIEEIERKIYK